MTNVFKKILNSDFLFLSVFLFALIKGFYFSFYGINIYDYGETLDNAIKILNGGILYRDIWTFFPPSFGYFPAIILNIFGKSLLIIRFVESSLFAVLVVLTALIANKLVSKYSIIVLSLTFIFSDLNTYLFFYYVFFWGALLLTIEYLRSQSNYLIFLSGILLGIGFTFRHDTALILLITVGITMLVAYKYKIVSNFRLGILSFLGGCLGVTALTLLFISRIWSVKEFLYMAFLQAPQINRGLSSGFNLGKFSLYTLSADQAFQFFTLFFYFTYIGIYVFTSIKLTRYFLMWESLKERNLSLLREQIIILCILIFGLLQMPHAFSIVELGHLIKAGIPAFILGFYLLENSFKKTRSLIVRIILISPVALFLVGNIVISVWWIDFNDTRTVFANGWVYLNSKYIPGTTFASSETIRDAVSFIQENTQNNDFIFTAPYQAILYFLADRKNPTKFNNFALGITTPGDEIGIINSLQSKNVKIIIYDPKNGPFKRSFSLSSPLVHQYIMNHYNIAEETKEGWLFMIKK